jgi:hypothetical protein
MILSAVVLAAALGFGPREVAFEPPNPTSRSFIVVRMRYWTGCHPTARLPVRMGNSIEITWPTFPPGGGCAGAIWLHDESIPIGMLEPGQYEVKLQMHPSAPVRTLSFTVAEAAPRLQFIPPVVSTRGETELTIRAANDCFYQPVVIIDGRNVPATSSLCELKLVAPPHAPGPVDVMVQSGGQTRFVRSTLQYVDPDAPPDDGLFERVLVPVLFSTPGAFGSQWVTAGTIKNRSRTPLVWNGFSLQPLDSASLAPLGDHPNGLLLFVPRAIADNVGFQTVVRNAAAEDGSWGTEVPVVRERDFAGDQLAILNVPIDKRNRTRLRIYGVDGEAETVAVMLAPDSRGASPTAYITLAGGTGEHPAYAEVDLAKTFPAYVDKGPFTVRVLTLMSVSRYWAMVSVTNNATQHITVLTP